ncbi:transcription factor HES-1-like [Liolophura sinensis]|uniref:transcription factor HES-1-like n=1 Tax=Liolophura sinensis TaxID=3198878 RepID=UPI003158DF07
MSSDEDISSSMDAHPSMSREKLRKLTKPLMEKRRRARINACLNQLKNLVLEAMNQNTSHFSKLEKADILEMTVKHLSQLQRRQAESQKQLDGCGVSRFRAGYAECAQEVARCLATVDQRDSVVGLRVMEHLAQRIQFSSETKVNSPLNHTSTILHRQPVYRHPCHQSSMYLPTILPPSTSPAIQTGHSDKKMSYPEYIQTGVQEDEGKVSSTDAKVTIRSPHKSRKSSTPTRFPVSDAYRETFNISSNSDMKKEAEMIKTDQSEPVWRPW